ncbi:hypothetical protein B7494_g1785 [Chlorociboria aeruginascens]|nr:hypothetical protein B7494_g1785 [Chlorociboria aeruginascens]
MAPFLQEPFCTESLPDLHTTKIKEQNAVPSKIVGPLVWDGKQFKDVNEYTYRLSIDEVCEIEDALGNFQNQANEQTFVLPTLGTKLKKLAQELHHGRGFVVISGLDSKRYSPEDNIIIFLGVGAYLGETRGMQTDDGKLFAHLRDAKQMKATQADRPIKDSNRFAAFHNDLCTDIIAIQTRSSAESGGEQLIASVSQIYNELLKTKPDVARLLLKPDWPMDIRRRFCNTDTRPLFWKHEGKLLASVIPDALIGFENVQRPANLPKLNIAQVSALNEVQALAHRFKLSLPTREGDLTFINNFAVLHAREEFQDSEQNRRYLVRMWLKNNELAWKLPEQLQTGNDMIFYDEKLPYHPTLPTLNARSEAAPAWEHSFLNPATRIDSLSLVGNPTWDVDGAEPDGRQIWAIPRFARYKSPRRIDVYVGDLADSSNPSLQILRPGSLQLASRKAAGQSDISRHILRALEFWSSQFEDFEEEYMSSPFGSQITIATVEVDVKRMDIALVPRYDLERQWLSVASLEEMWDLPHDALMPPGIDIEELRFKEQLYDSIGLVEIDGREGESLVLKTISLDTKALYHELNTLITLPPHPNVSPPPLYFVTKKVRFGGKRGVCGFLMSYYPLGTVDALLRSGNCPDLPLLLKWAKQLTEAMIHVRNSPARTYTDLNPRNIAIVESTEGSPELVLIDYDQGTPGYTRAPPEIKYVTTIEKLACSNTIGPIQQDYISLMRSLIPSWTPFDPSTRYTKDYLSPSAAWLALNTDEEEGAMAYMLGKQLWALFEGAADYPEPASVAGFRLPVGSLEFGAFDKTPLAMRDIIKRCTVGADEWNGIRQPFVIRGGKIYARNLETGEVSDSVAIIQESARAWWEFEIERSKKYFSIRKLGCERQLSPSDEAFVNFLSKRPGLDAVLQAIETTIRNEST